MTATPLPALHHRDAVRLAGVGVVRGGNDALVGVDLSVRPGRLTVLTGPNGAGKSTVVEVLAGVLVPTTGSVTRAAGSTAYVPQRADVPDRLPVTVREVVTMGLWGELGAWRRVDAAGRRRVAQAIDALGLTALTRRPFATLSGGERQRALLAQGLARRADLVLLDEPTTGLDTESSAHICAAMLSEVARGAAVVAVSHDPAVVDLGDDVVALDAGRVAGPGD